MEMSPKSRPPSREHSIKVPRLFKACAKVLRSHDQGLGNLKTLIYAAKHPNVKGMLALLSTCLTHRSQLAQLPARLSWPTREPHMDPYLADVLVTELIWGKGVLPGRSRPVQTIVSYESDIRTTLTTLNSTHPGLDAALQRNVDLARTRPRYVRVNLLKTSLAATVLALQSEGFVLRPEHTDSENFLSRIQTLAPREFLIDHHLAQSLLVFAPGTAFYDHPLYRQGVLLLQDKASCLPVHALDIPLGAVVLDACAAPGMKTTQAAAAVTTSGQVYAVERDPKRYRVLKKMLEQSGARAITTPIKDDFLHLVPSQYPDVEYIILDPTCSGSGMLQPFQAVDTTPERLASLAELQAQLLIHAGTFPGVKKISYSTCSIMEAENESVVEAVLKNLGFAEQFELVPSVPTWPGRGHGCGYEACLRADPEQDLCNGFFVSIFQRRNHPT